MKKMMHVFTSIPMTAVSGVFLFLSFFLSHFGKNYVLNPAWISVCISGLPLLYLAVFRLRYNKGMSKISSALLISIAMVAAIAIGDLFAAGEVAFIMALGEILEDKTTARAQRGLKKLMSLAPAQARRIIEGREELVFVRNICRDDILRVLPGETIPVDGEILCGETSVDQSIMTGESLPVDKCVGDKVFCGTINCFGTVDIRVDKENKDCTLEKMIRLVREAEQKKAPMARVADKAASYLVPIALLISIVTYVVTGDIVRAVTVLVVFCPCALVLATPTAIMAAIGQATKHGVIIKSGEALEHLSKTDTIAFDKTGTLTYGELSVSDCIPINGVDENTLLSVCASAEVKSEHPIGKAIVAYAREKALPFAETQTFSMSVGKGICAQTEKNTILCGSSDYLKGKGVVLNKEIIEQLDILRGEGKASVIVAMDGMCIGMLALCDVLRAEAKSVVEKLNVMQLKTVLLSGDSTAAAAYFAERTNISEVRAELLPEQKTEAIMTMQEIGKCVCMIGDGVNDAPALSVASVGIAMGGMGSDIAVEAADIALVHDDISKVVYLKKLSVATVQTIKGSIALSMIINLLAVFMSVMGWLSPTAGALVHNAGSCFVVFIAALLYDRKF